MRKLKRINDPEFKWIGGVCAGVAYYFGAHTWIVRLIWAFIILWMFITDWNIPLSSLSVILYLLLSMFLPVWEEVPKDYRKICE